MTATTCTRDMRVIPLANLSETDAFNPRRSMAIDALNNLTESIRQHGVLQPVIVAPTDGDSWRIVAGHRRIAAAHRAGLTEVPAVVAESEPDVELDIAIIENLQREDLSPIDEAHAYERALKMGQLNQGELASRVKLHLQSRWLRKKAPWKGAERAWLTRTVTRAGAGPAFGLPYLVVGCIHG